MHYTALVEVWPDESMAFFRELPGCLSSALTYEEAITTAPAAIAAHLQWLKANGLLEKMDNEIALVVGETIEVSDGQKGPRFEADQPPPADDEIDNALNVAAMARVDLLQVYESLPEHDRDRSPRPGEWSINEHMWHIVEAEAWYISRLTEHPGANPANSLPSDVSKALLEIAMDSEQALRELTATQRERVYLHEDEEWTAAKVLRRLVGHLREHYPWIEAIAREL